MQLRKFIGMVNFYRRSIPTAAEIQACLTSESPAQTVDIRCIFTIRLPGDFVMATPEHLRSWSARRDGEF